MAAKAPSATITHEDIQHLCGEHAASEAPYEDLKTAMTWAEGQDDIIGPAEHPLTGRAMRSSPLTKTSGANHGP
jgi:hypothetical protein